MKLSVSKMNTLPIKVGSVWTPGYKVKHYNSQMKSQSKTNTSTIFVSKYIHFAEEKRL